MSTTRDHLHGSLAGLDPAAAAVRAQQRLDRVISWPVNVEAIAGVWGLDVFLTDLPATVESTLTGATVLVRASMPPVRIRKVIAVELGKYLLGTDEARVIVAFAEHLLLPDPLVDEFLNAGRDAFDVCSKAEVPLDTAGRRLHERAFARHSDEAIDVAMSYPTANVIELRPRRH